jgi:hypothetical protein
VTENDASNPVRFVAFLLLSLHFVLLAMHNIYIATCYHFSTWDEEQVVSLSKTVQENVVVPRQGDDTRVSANQRQ